MPGKLVLGGAQLDLVGAQFLAQTVELLARRREPVFYRLYLCARLREVALGLAESRVDVADLRVEIGLALLRGGDAGVHERDLLARARKLVLRLTRGQRAGGGRGKSDDESDEDRYDDEGARQRHRVH